jgi:multidrug efflux pump subunit AcrB
VVANLVGQPQLLADTMSSLQTGLGMAVVVIFLLLAANFQSFRLSLVVLSVVPAVVAGSLLMLLATGATLNLQSYMGMIMSVGVSVANAILLITSADHLRHEHRDVPLAARLAADTRVRPILMTSIAMIAGMLPMASGLGEGGDQIAPLGQAVIGGLIASTLASLLVLPHVFGWAMRRVGYESVSMLPARTRQAA